MVRGRFAEESGVSDRPCDEVDVSEWSLTVSESSSLFRFTADEEGRWGPTEAILGKSKLVSPGHSVIKQNALLVAFFCKT
jgi:hypothetical protein